MEMTAGTKSFKMPLNGVGLGLSLFGNAFAFGRTGDGSFAQGKRTSEGNWLCLHISSRSQERLTAATGRGVHLKSCVQLLACTSLQRAAAFFYSEHQEKIC